MEIDKLLLDKFNVRRRFVEERDAEFILSLRLDEKKGRFLSKTDNDIEKQKLAEDVVSKLNNAYSYFEQKRGEYGKF
jgi:hypothetical protein